MSNMFYKHNTFCLLTSSIVLLNGVFGLLYGWNILQGLLNFSSWEETAYWLVIALSIGASIYGGTLILRKKLSGFVICICVYAIQLFGVITESYNFVVTFGLNISTSTDLGALLDLNGMSLEINLVALTILVLSGISLSTLKKVPRDANCT